MPEIVVPASMVPYHGLGRAEAGADGLARVRRSVRAVRDVGGVRGPDGAIVGRRMAGTATVYGAAVDVVAVVASEEEKGTALWWAAE